MKTNSKVILALLALGTSAMVIIAQDNSAQPNGQGGPGGPGMRGRRPVPPVIRALDANHDGVVDADEIANAPAALKTLDKNGDGKLTMDELLPPPPQGKGGGQGHPPGGPDFDGPPPGDQQ